MTLICIAWEHTVSDWSYLDQYGSSHRYSWVMIEFSWSWSWSWSWSGQSFSFIRYSMNYSWLDQTAIDVTFLNLSMLVFPVFFLRFLLVHILTLGLSKDNWVVLETSDLVLCWYLPCIYNQRGEDEEGRRRGCIPTFWYSYVVMMVSLNRDSKAQRPILQTVLQPLQML